MVTVKLLETEGKPENEGLTVRVRSWSMTFQASNFFSSFQIPNVIKLSSAAPEKVVKQRKQGAVNHTGCNYPL